MNPVFDMHTVRGFVEALDGVQGNPWADKGRLRHLREQANAALPEAGNLHCPQCGAGRRMKIDTFYIPQRAINVADRRLQHQRLLGQPSGRSIGPSFSIDDLVTSLVPSLFELACVQCGTTFHALITAIDGLPSLITSPSTLGGLRTPHTPPGVSFYLDQAYRARSMAAHSAAMAMYRAAVEHLLYEQGYKDGMLGTKLNKLESDQRANQAPAPLQSLDTEFLSALKQLGDGAIHPNDGDVKRQDVIDRDLLALVEQTLAHLLFFVYEAPRERQQNLNKLRATASTIKR